MANAEVISGPRPTDVLQAPEGSEILSPQRTLMIIAHAYQPPREYLLLGEPGEQRADVVASVNEQIYQECYKPNFVDREQLPDGLLMSFYAPLRDWIKHHHPEEFDIIRERINALEDKEYRVLGDPYMHIILPLLSPEDQDTWVKIGKQAFEDDFGFTPKGMWLPETAVSATTIRVLHNNGYKFVVLRDTQLQSAEQPIMHIPVRDENGKETADAMTVVHFDSEISGSVSYPDPKNDITHPVQKFLSLPQFAHKSRYAIATDMEYYGHHQKFKDQWLAAATNKYILAKFGFQTFDVKKALEETPYAKTDIWDNSSWSCDHELGRWKGTCGCGLNPDNPDWSIVDEIHKLYQDVDGKDKEIDKRLDELYPAGWRDTYVRFFLGTREAVFQQGDIDDEIETLRQQEDMDILRNEKVVPLFKAHTAVGIAEISCFGFFRDKADRPERELAQGNLVQIQKLVPDINEAVIYNAA
ncbi:MAG: hypothetical protein HY430_01070 [Candidatus Levybacteria bacterium]|nr:hypothetical protein [Candidatus Levybacteria bacterium]